MSDVEVVPAYPAAEVRAAEAPVLAKVRDGALMDHAAAALATTCLRRLREIRGRVVGTRVVLLVGGGNNGGDALLAGARLRSRGVDVQAIVASEGVYLRGLSALTSAGVRPIDVRSDTGRKTAQAVLGRADLVVDGLVGLGFRGVLAEPMASLVNDLRDDVSIVAVDVPSGVDVDTGEVHGPHVRADVTVTFGAMKPCLLVPPAAYAAGKVEFVDVGISAELPTTPSIWRLTVAGARARWPVPRHDDHKYRRGVLGVVAGSDTYPGAAVLACAGAVRAGVGIVRYVGPSGATAQVIAARPEVVPGIGRVQAWLLGSGVENDPAQDAAIATALASGLPCVVDAGALEACVRARIDRSAPAPGDQVLLTPHAGELTRMLNLLGHPVDREAVESGPLHHVRWLAKAVDATVLLKGPVTLVADPDGQVASQADGPAWLATAGSGDVLAGIAGALMTAGLNAITAGAMAAMVHGRAAVRASDGGPIGAADVAESTPATVADLLRGGPTNLHAS